MAPHAAGPSTPRSPRAGESSSRAAALSTSTAAPSSTTSAGRSTPRAARGTSLNFLSCFKPTATDDDTNTSPPTPHVASPSSSTAGPSTSHATEGGRLDSIEKKKQAGHDQLAKDKKKIKLNVNFEVGSSSQSQNTADIQSFTFEELQVATGNFSSECLGEGGFGKVYKGHLDKENQDVAIKTLNPRGEQGIREFVMEVEVLRKANHPNLVKLLGFCAEKEHKLLVYEYMALGSLHRHLFVPSPDRPPLDWETRMKIAIDIASGLECLHDKMIPNIIHLDPKSENILLDEEYHAKLSDFGTARIAPVGDKSIHVWRNIIGSPGYIAPEYDNTGHLSRKSDIYTFGVVLLELITGRLAFDLRKPVREQCLAKWAKPLLRIKDMQRLEQFADPRLGGQYNNESLSGALDLAERCIDSKAKMRPAIAEVLHALNRFHPS